MRRLVNKNLAKLISNKTLLRLKKPNNSTHLESFTLYKLVQVKFSLKFNLCVFKKLAAFWLSTPLNKTLKEANCYELLVNTKVLYQSLHQILSFWVIFRSQILLSKFFLFLIQFILKTFIRVFGL